MSRYVLIGGVLLAAVVLTSLSYFMTDNGTAYECITYPPNPSSRMDLSIHNGMLSRHGFPLRFYSTGSPPGCILSDGDPGADGPAIIASQLDVKNLVADYALWTIASGVVISALQKVKKK
jgi:hypothetical protein